MFLEVHLNKDTAILNVQFLVKKKSCAGSGVGFYLVLTWQSEKLSTD